MALSATTRRERGLAALAGTTRGALLAWLGWSAHGAGLLALDALADAGVDRCSLLAPIVASQMLVFLMPGSRFGTPWNVAAGHALAGLVALLVTRGMPAAPAVVTSALAAPLAGLAMIATSSFHPPAGLTVIALVLSQSEDVVCTFVLPLIVATVTLAALRLALDAAVERSMRPHGGP